jgi:hypothetical protein
VVLMPVRTQPPESDLLIPLPDPGDSWDPHTLHTHYFGLSVPEAKLGGFIYIRYMPYFGLCQGGVCLFRGMQNIHSIDMAFCDYQITMPYPTVQGNRIATANGLAIEFTKPGSEARITYASADGTTTVDVLQTALTPLIARGHGMPGEEDHHDDPTLLPGGSEQMMHCVGEVRVRGERFDVDCFAVRDRSWRQVRSEAQGGAKSMPGIAWSPMYFGPDLCFNQISIEAPDTNPAWAGHFEIPDGAPTHHYGWLYDGQDVHDLVRVRRNVLDYHPHGCIAIKQEIEAEDERGRVHRFTGEALCTAPIPAWPNAGFHDSVYRWQDEQGRVTHCTYQEIWSDRHQHAMRAFLGSAA